MTIGNLVGTGKESMAQIDDGSALSNYVRTQLDPSLTWADLSWLVEQTHLPVVVKGVVRADDAKSGRPRCEGIVVSNHGGRCRYGSPNSADFAHHR